MCVEVSGDKLVPDETGRGTCLGRETRIRGIVNSGTFSGLLNIHNTHNKHQTERDVLVFEVLPSL